MEPAFWATLLYSGSVVQKAGSREIMWWVVKKKKAEKKGEKRGKKSKSKRRDTEIG